MSMFSKNLHKYLSQNAIKQVDLARALEVPPTTVSGWLRGAHEPSIDMLLTVCELLNVPVGEMVGDKLAVNMSASVAEIHDMLLTQKQYIRNLEDELEECKAYIIEKEAEVKSASEALKRECTKCKEPTEESFGKFLKVVGAREVVIKI